MYLMDLDEGKLFIWKKMRHEIHKIIKNVDDSGDKVITRCVAWRGHDTDPWTAASRDSDQTFDALADVQEVKLTLTVEDVT